MAVVYLAHDLRHDRKVALKVLRPELAAILGGERFLHEIRTTANLQHPHILPLHDSGEADGIVYYVMPYIEGETLRDRINHEKQLPVDDAIRIAREVASALDYAHRHSVVHRDIKPENILLHDGQAVVADFGIALAVSTVGGGTRMTETGMSLGTPHYMAPEQAMGDREITPRADIYALGCVAYEMLTGEPPFTGTTAQAIVARVVTENPRGMTLQRHTIPAHVESAVLKSLEKLPADRFASAAEFSAALGNPSFTSATTAARAVPRRHKWEGRIAAAAIVLALMATAFGAWAFNRGNTGALPVTRYGLALPTNEAPRVDRPFAVAPDGSRLVYVGPGTSNQQMLWVKERDRHDAVQLGGTEGVMNFTFSPDAQWLAFVQQGRLKKVSLSGGAAITLTDSASNAAPGLTWMDDGRIVYVLTGSRELRAVPAVGGSSELILRLDSQTVTHPTALPGARRLLFVRCRGGRCGLEQDLWALNLGNGETRQVQAGVAMARYVPTGHIVYVRRDGAMLGARFDAGSMTMRGAPMPLADSIALLNDVWPLMDVSRSGTLVVRPGVALTSRERYEMVYVDRTGRESLIDSSWSFRFTVFGSNVGWALSPDGTRLAIGLNTDAGDDIWVKLLPKGPVSRVTYDSASDYRPRWTPDGRNVMFASNRTPAPRLYRRAADGTGQDTEVYSAPGGLYEGVLSSNGEWILGRTGGTLGQVGGRNITGRRLSGDTTSVPLLATAFDEAAIALSPDGRWMAYESNETGQTEVYVRPFPNTQDAKWQVSNGGGVAPLWDRRGRELYYLSRSRDMMARTVTGAGTALRMSEPRALFRMRDDLYLADPENYTPFDITPDGRFIMARRLRTTASLAASPLIVADNWFTELRQRTEPGSR